MQGFLFTKYWHTITYNTSIQIEPSKIWIISFGFNTIQMIPFDFCKKKKNFELSTIENLIIKKIRIVQRQKASHLKKGSFNRTIKN